MKNRRKQLLGFWCLRSMIRKEERISLLFPLVRAVPRNCRVADVVLGLHVQVVPHCRTGYLSPCTPSDDLRTEPLFYSDPGVKKEIGVKHSEQGRLNKREKPMVGTVV